MLNVIVSIFFAIAWHACYKTGWLPYVGSAVSPLLFYAFVGSQIGHPFSWPDFFEAMKYFLPVSFVISVVVGLGFRIARTRRNKNQLTIANSQEKSGTDRD